MKKCKVFLIFSLVIVLTATFALTPIKTYAALQLVDNTLQNTAGDTLYGLQSYGEDLYWFDETTGEMLTDITIEFSNIVFEVGPDGKITRKTVLNPFTNEEMDTFGVPKEGYEDDPRVILSLWGLSKNGFPYALYSDGVNTFSCGHFTQKAFNAIEYICTRSSSHYQAVSSRQPDTMTSGGYAISSLTKGGQLVYPKLIFSSDESEGTPSLEEVTLRVGDIIFYEYINGGENLFDEGAQGPGGQFPNGPYYDYMHAPENQGVYEDVKYIHHSSIYVGQGKIMESGLNNDYNGVHVCSLRQSSDTDQLRVKYIYRYIDDDDENEKAITLDDKKVENVEAVRVDSNTVELTWDPVTGAEGYLVYGASEGSPESLKGTVQGGTVATFIDENASDIYRVCAYNTILDTNQKKLSPISDPTTVETETYTITASASQGGSIDPPGDITVERDSNITFTFTPDEGYEVSEVIIDGQSQGPCSSYEFQNIMGDHTIEVNFSQIATQQHRITLNYNSTCGKVRINGVEYGSENECLVNNGDMADIEITAEDGYRISKVQVDGVERDDISDDKQYSFSLEINEDITIQVEYTAVTYTITVSASVYGTITPSDNVTVDPDGSITANHNEHVVFTVTPDSGYIIDEVLVDGTPRNVENKHGFSFGIDILKDLTISASFTYDDPGSDTGNDDESGSDNDSDTDSEGDSGPSGPVPSVPKYTAELKDGSNQTGSLSVTVDEKNAAGTASLDDTKAEEFFRVSGTILMPSIPDVSTYRLELSADFLMGAGDSKLTLSSEAADIVIPGNMLSTLPDAAGKKAGISVGHADKEQLTDDEKAAVGDRPLIELKLTKDGETASWSNPDAPVIVSITYTPSAEELENPENIVIWYLDGSGKLVCIPNGCYNPELGTVTFSTTHFSMYAVGYNPVVFSDVTSDAWYSKAVSFIAARNITLGTGGGKYSPESRLTRSDFLVMLMRAYDIKPDTDISDNFADAGNTYYTGYLAAAKRLGISTGVGNNLFAPDKDITRQEMFTLLYRALRVIGMLPEKSEGILLTDFSDAKDIQPWARVAMSYLTKAGTIAGSGGKLHPTDATTRAEIAQVLYNLLNR